MAGELWVWMNGERVGTWSVNRAGVHRLSYFPEWLQSSRARPLSLSLPFTATLQIAGQAVEHYFDNLLPDNERVRERLRRTFRTRNSDAFSLLEALGRDCIGAVQLLPPDMPPDGWNQIDVTPLDNATIASFLRSLPTDPWAPVQADTELFRISLAGAQLKGALTRVGQQWCRPNNATPTTHILKLPLSQGTITGIDIFDSVQNEWLCARILAALGLPTASSEMATFEEQGVLVVERFDREWRNQRTWIARLPQEDFCQASGLSPGQKYEAEGGPGIAQCMQLLAGSADAQQDRLVFQLALLAYWLMAAIDGHAKNFSFFLDAGATYTLTPLYDVISVWPYVGTSLRQLHRKRIKLSMALRSKNPHYVLDEIQGRHWRRLAMANGGVDVWTTMISFVQGVGPALDSVQDDLPADFPDRIWTPISQLMREQAERFLQQADVLR